MNEPIPEYFYTRDTPYEWSSGPKVFQYNPYTFDRIASLEEARELAERESGWQDNDHVGYYAQSDRIFYVTSYGVRYRVE